VSSRSDKRQRELDAAIRACEDETGHAIPKVVVAAAQDPTHPSYEVLTLEFNWNVQEAAQAHWEDRARELIREVRVMVVYGDAKIATPVYVSDPRVPESSFIRTVRIARSGPTKRAVLQAECDRIASAINRAIGLAVVFDLEQRFENALAEIMMAANELGSRDDDGDDDDGGSASPRGPEPSPAP